MQSSQQNPQVRVSKSHSQSPTPTCSSPEKQKLYETKPTRLSAYLEERSEIKRETLILNEESKVQKRSLQKKSSLSVRVLHRNIDKLTSELISGLESKKNSLLKSWCQGELIQAQKLLNGWVKLIFERPDAAELPPINKESANEKPSPNLTIEIEDAPQTRQRCITFSVPVLNIQEESQPKPIGDDVPHFILNHKDRPKPNGQQLANSLGKANPSGRRESSSSVGVSPAQLLRRRESKPRPVEKVIRPGTKTYRQPAQACR